MRAGFRAKLFLASLTVLCLCFAAADAFLTRGLASDLSARITLDLSVRAELVARAASEQTAPLDDLDAWDAFADAIAKTAHARVTFVRRDGTVIGDSEVPRNALSGMEHHDDRPEVRAAFEGAHGESTRVSKTLGETMVYVAAPLVRRPPLIEGAVRIASPVNDVDQAIARARRIVWGASAVALAVALVVSSIAADRMSRGVRFMTEVARRMTAGDLDVRTREEGTDELGDLGRALDKLAEGLSGTLSELRAERDRQAWILEGMQEGVLLLDESQRVVMVNGALRSMLLLGPNIEGRLLIELIRHAELHELIKRARSGRTTALGEIDLGGIKPRRVLIHASAPREGGSIIAVFVDVTELRRLESLRRDFVANVSHELRTPVTAVRSAAETLRDSALKDPNPEAAQRFVAIIDRNAERLQALIEDLLELSRLESKQFTLKNERVDPAVVAPLVLGLFRERAERKGLTLSSNIDPGFSSLRTDQRALEQVLSNLVDNAVKYCPAGSKVNLHIFKQANQIRFAVEDSGPGIDPKHFPRLFERFYRVDAGRSREVGGTGLGLSIVKHLMDAMGGEVHVESAVGKGTTFTISLPVK